MVQEIISREKLVPKEMPCTREIDNILDVLSSLSITLDKLQTLLADYGRRLQWFSIFILENSFLPAVCFVVLL